MYINDLDKVWLKHPSEWQCFEVDRADTLNIILESGITEIFIDTGLGTDTGSEDTGKAGIDGIYENPTT